MATSELNRLIKKRKLNGMTTEYYPGKKIKIKQNYEFGKRNGLAKSYYENGALKKTVMYKNAPPNGGVNSFNRVFIVGE